MTPEREASLAQMRRRMMTIARLHGTRYQGEWVPAKNFMSAADDQGNAVVNEQQCEELLDWLIEHGLLEEWNPKELGVKRTFAGRRFKLTNKGWQLWSEQLDPIPGVADERLGG